MSLHTLANHMSAHGRGPDSTLVHMSPREVQGLQALAMRHGGSLTINPQTGLPEAGILENLLPAIAGFALNAFAPGIGGAVGSALGLTGGMASAVGTGLIVGGVTGLASGSLEKGLMAGLGGYGGAGLGGALVGAGSPSVAMDAASGARDAGMSAAAQASPAATVARLQAGANTVMSAPFDALKNNALNIGLASAPVFMDSFGGDDKEETAAPKRQSGNLYVYGKDPLTGKSVVQKTYSGDEVKNAPPVVFGNAHGGLMQHYDEGGPVEKKKLEPVKFSSATEAVDANGNPITPATEKTISDSQRAQDYLLGKPGATNPFLFYSKGPAAAAALSTAPVAALSTAGISSLTPEFVGRGGSGGGGERGPSDYGSGKGLAQFGGSGFTGATTDKYGDSGPLEGAALFGNKAAAFLGNLGLTSLSDAIAKNVDTNYGHEGAVGMRKALEGGMGVAPAPEGQTLAEINAQRDADTRAFRQILDAQQEKMDRASGYTEKKQDAADAAMRADAQAAAAQNAAIQESRSNYGGYSGGDGGAAGRTSDSGSGQSGSGGWGRGAIGGLATPYGIEHMAHGGGITALAQGGMYNLGSYSDGGRLLRGPGDGVSDDIPATIGQNQPARLADGEFVIPARIVSELGNGSTEAGARKLYAMMDRVQKARSKTVGKNKVAANSRADKYLPV